MKKNLTKMLIIVLVITYTLDMKTKDPETTPFNNEDVLTYQQAVTLAILLDQQAMRRPALYRTGAFHENLNPEDATNLPVSTTLETETNAPYSNVLVRRIDPSNTPLR